MRPVLSICTLLIGCVPAVPRTEAPITLDPSAELASLERTSCFGDCPAYRVSVSNGGKVTWQGRNWVVDNREDEAQVPAERLAELREAFEQAKYFELDGDFNCRGWTDNPTATTSFNDGTRRRTIVHYHGCVATPGIEKLSKLERRIDEILGTEKWVPRL